MVDDQTTTDPIEFLPEYLMASMRMAVEKRGVYLPPDCYKLSVEESKDWNARAIHFRIIIPNEMKYQWMPVMNPVSENGKE